MKKFFDLKLYREGLRSLRVFGIITTVLLTLYSVVAVVSLVLEAMYITGVGEDYVEYASLTTVNPLLVLLFCVVAPLMTIMAFSFTANRAASDYYFAIPKTRGCIFFSFFGAVMSWVIFAATVSSVLPLIISLIFNKYIVINILASLVFFLEVMVAAFFVASAVTIAVGVTGNLITTVLVALMIIFLPRIFIMVISNISLMNLPIVDTISAVPLLSFKHQIPFGFVLSIFYEGGFYTAPTLSAFIYTLAVGIIYLILGYAFFLRRNSEASGKSAATNKLQAIFRICLSSAVGLFVPVMLFSAIFENEEMVYIVIAVVAFSILSFVVFCCYELISTKSAKSMVRAMPSFFVVVALELAIFGSMHLVRSVTVNYTPEPQQIDGIYLTTNSYNEDYWNKLSSEVLIENTEAKVIVSEALKENVKYCTLDNPLAYYSKYHSENGGYTGWNVTFLSDGIKHSRYISIDAANSERLVEILEATPEYKKIYTDFPTLKDASTNVNIYEFGLTSKQEDSIYEAYLRDIKNGNIGFEEIYNHINIGYDICFEINVSTIVGLENYDFYLPVTADCTETLLALYKTIDKDNATNSAKALELLKKEYNEESEKEMYVDLRCINFGDGYSYEYSENRLEILKNAVTDNFTADSKVVYLTLNIYDNENYKSYDYRILFALTESQAEKFINNK